MAGRRRLTKHRPFRGATVPWGLAVVGVLFLAYHGNRSPWFRDSPPRSPGTSAVRPDW